MADPQTIPTAEKNVKRLDNEDSVESHKAEEPHPVEESSPPQSDRKESQIEKKGRFTVKPQSKVETQKTSTIDPSKTFIKSPNDSTLEKATVFPKVCSNPKISTEMTPHPNLHKTLSEYPGHNAPKEDKRSEFEDPGVAKSEKAKISGKKEEPKEKREDIFKSKPSVGTKESSSKIEETTKKPAKEGVPQPIEEVHSNSGKKEEKEEKKAHNVIHTEEISPNFHNQDNFLGIAEDSGVNTNTARNIMIARSEGGSKSRSDSIHINTPIPLLDRGDSVKQHTEASILREDESRSINPSNLKREQLVHPLQQEKIKINNEKQPRELEFMPKQPEGESDKAQPFVQAKQNSKAVRKREPTHPSLLYPTHPSHRMEEHESGDDEYDEACFLDKPPSSGNERDSSKIMQRERFGKPKKMEREFFQQMEAQRYNEEYWETKFGKYYRRLSKLQTEYDSRIDELQLIQGEMMRVVGKMQRARERIQDHRSQLPYSQFRELRQENSEMKSELAQLRAEVEKYKKHKLLFK